MREPIKIYRFQDAPPEFQAKFRNGGDEDWIIYIPPEYTEEEIQFDLGLGHGYTPVWKWVSGPCRVKGYKGQIWITSHA